MKYFVAKSDVEYFNKVGKTLRQLCEVGLNGCISHTTPERFLSKKDHRSVTNVCHASLQKPIKHPV